MRAPIALILATTAPSIAQLQPEWDVQTGLITLGSPRIADVDADGVMDVVQGTAGPVGAPYDDGHVYVFDAAGDPLPGFPTDISRPIFHAPCVGDVDADGMPEIVVQAWEAMHAWNHDGTVVDGWPIATGAFTSNAPCLADLDADGVLDVIYTAGTVMHAIRADGSSLAGWPVVALESFQAPSAGDIDGDGEVENVAGTWRPQFPEQVDFELYAWNADGSLVDGFPVGGLGSVRGSVSLGDLDGDGTVELVTRAGDTLHVFDASGSEREGWPVSPGAPIRNATPTIGDLDGDGDLEIVIGAFDVFAYHHDGALVDGFPADTDATGNINSSAAIATVDDEAATLEILVKISDAIEGFNHDASDAAGFPYALSDDNNSGTFSPGPATGDVDDDGDVEMVFTSIVGQIVYFDEPGPSKAPLQWPQTGYDARNSSFIPREQGCAADCDGNGSLNVLDFVCFQQEWQAQSETTATTTASTTSWTSSASSRSSRRGAPSDRRRDS